MDASNHYLLQKRPRSEAGTKMILGYLAQNLKSSLAPHGENVPKVLEFLKKVLALLTSFFPLGRHWFTLHVLFFNSDFLLGDAVGSSSTSQLQVQSWV